LLLFIFFAKSLYKHGYTQIYQVAKNQKNFVKFEAFIILQSLRLFLRVKNLRSPLLFALLRNNITILACSFAVRCIRLFYRKVELAPENANYEQWCG
ncbi:MAG: hypothetical protein L3J54_14785, partial [Draconibacterium sp.]|nr:hypothetical protein [Draconibacterium sp.]